jgi:hypothetical protein
LVDGEKWFEREFSLLYKCQLPEIGLILAAPYASILFSASGLLAGANLPAESDETIQKVKKLLQAFVILKIDKYVCYQANSAIPSS